MFLLEDTVVTSATDIILSATCEFSFLRKLDQKLGRDVQLPVKDDEMLMRAGLLGDAHEARWLATYIATHGSANVAQIARPEKLTVAALFERQEQTVAALNSSAEIVFQATFFEQVQHAAVNKGDVDIAFVGFADFISRVATDQTDTVWQVEDTKVARSPKPQALIQIAAYAEQLQRLGFKTHENGVIILGDDRRSEHPLREVTPVLRSRRERMYELINMSVRRKDDAATVWGDPDIFACGRCEVCEPEIIEARDPLLIGGIRVQQRDRLLAAGFKTIDEVAAAKPLLGTTDLQVPGMNQRVLEKLILQASLQLASEKGTDGKPVYEVFDALSFAVLPPPDAGDLFFDFEGDPLFMAELASGKKVWGLDYLFGMVDEAENFTAFWAHDLEQERVALEDFMSFVSKRREKYPEMHIYHYAPYEKTHLKTIAARHGVCEAEIDDLLRAEVLVDLYHIVKQTMLIGSASYSIKKLEPLYMGEEKRDTEGVTTGSDSVAEYAQAAQLLSSSDAAERSLGQKKLDDIAEYNKYDCVSTLRLRDWLLSLAAKAGIQAAGTKTASADIEDVREVSPEVAERSALAKKLLAAANAFESEKMFVERQVYAMAASAIDYHSRERKMFWWEHFDRLAAPLTDWADTRDVFVSNGDTTVVSEWGRPPRARKDQRQILMQGTFAPGSKAKQGDSVFAIYDDALGPDVSATSAYKYAQKATIVSVEDSAVVIKELAEKEAEHWHGYPIALTPGRPPAPGSQPAAIANWGAKLLKAYEAHADELKNFVLPLDPVVDIIARRKPHLKSLTGLPVPDLGVDDGTIVAVTHSILDLHDSALAVQGPPGTGKTYLAARVIKYLVENYGWKVGVVAQSHKVVENVLDGIVKAGLNAELVVKQLQNGVELEEQLFTPIENSQLGKYLGDRDRAQEGCVIGGTAWLFSNEARFAENELDLLVIDEAGQFSIAPTIASSYSANRLLLLGDPNQLPQVTQGTHPEPVDESALGWLLGGREVLSADLGYFLPETRRMRPELTKHVSELSYAGKLVSHSSTRNLKLPSAVGAPGLIWHPIQHSANNTSSVEEAEKVTEIVTQMRAAQIPQNEIIVVAPYNAQVETISLALIDANHAEVRVGTVDKFQGQEAVIAIVSLAASSPADVPRGLDFLLMPNRLNVAISRAKWSAHLVSSTSLSGSGIPSSYEEMRALSAYLRLIQSADDIKG